ncbi:UNVERIFIED_ORG: hypothetical protein M2328_006455 [Rhodococcus erythropolis]
MTYPITPVRVTVSSTSGNGRGSADFGLDDLLGLFGGFGN